MSILKTVATFIVANKSSVAAGAAIAGVIFTAAVAGKSALDAEEVLQSMDEEATKAEKAKAIAPQIISTAIVAGGTIALIIFAHRADLKAQSTLLSALALSEASKNDKVKLLKEKLSPEQQKEVATEMIVRSEAEVVDLGGDILFYDQFLDRKFLCSEEIIQAAAGRIAMELAGGLDRQSLNDFYDYIYEMASNPKGRFNSMGAADKFGWAPGYDIGPYISMIDADKVDGKPAIVLDYTYNQI
jgi:hypothetical protein